MKPIKAEISNGLNNWQMTITFDNPEEPMFRFDKLNRPGEFEQGKFGQITQELADMLAGKKKKKWFFVKRDKDVIEKVRGLIGAMQL